MVDLTNMLLAAVKTASKKHNQNYQLLTEMNEVSVTAIIRGKDSSLKFTTQKLATQDMEEAQRNAIYGLMRMILEDGMHLMHMDLESKLP